MEPTERALACHQCASRGSAVAVRKHLSLLSHIGTMVGCLGFALVALCKHFSPVKSRDFAVKVCNPGGTRKDREREGGVEPPQSGL